MIIDYYYCHKSNQLQIAHSDMHHPVCGINSLIHSVSLASQSCLDSPPHSLVSSSVSSSPLVKVLDAHQYFRCLI